MNYEVIIAHLSVDLPTELKECQSQLNDCLKHRTAVLQERVSAQSVLARGKAQVRRPKDIKEYTDLDRNIMLESDVRELTEAYETAKGLEALLSERVQVLSSLLLQMPQGSITGA